MTITPMKKSATLAGALVSFNPMKVTQPQDTFKLSANGFIQGAFEDDNTARQLRSQGVIDASVTGVMYGGMAISEKTSNGKAMGGSILIADTTPHITGFSTFDGMYNAIIVPGNEVPKVVAPQSIQYFRFGTNARIAVKCSDSLAAALVNGLINQQVSWDFVNQQLIAYDATPGALPVKIVEVRENSSTIADDGSGNLTYVNGFCALIQL